MKRTAVVVASLVLFLCTVALAASTEAVFAFESASYQLIPKKSVKLEPVAQGIDEKLSYEWESSDTDVATVSKGTVKAVAQGTTTITCAASSEGGETYTAECTVEVLNPIKKISTPEKSIELPSQTQFTPDVTIEPEDASIKELDWETSDQTVVAIFNDGTMQTGTAGTATLTGTAKDGSGKSVKIKVTVPKVYVSEKNITITDPEGVVLEYQNNINGISTVSVTGSAFYTDSMKDNGNISRMKLIPASAGSGSIVFKGNGKTVATVKVKVEHSAVYDKVSCPPTTVEALIERKDDCIGERVGMTGTVCGYIPDVGSKEAGRLVLNDGSGYFVFWYHYAATVENGKKITVYGPVLQFIEYETETGLKYECPQIDPKGLAM